jgi:hypothetical protein
MRLHNPLSPEPIGQAGNERQENDQVKEEGSSPRTEEQFQGAGEARGQGRNQVQAQQVGSIESGLEESRVPQKDHRSDQAVMRSPQSSRRQNQAQGKGYGTSPSAGLMKQSQEPEERAGSLMHGTVASLSMEVTWK